MKVASHRNLHKTAYPGHPNGGELEKLQIFSPNINQISSDVIEWDTALINANVFLEFIQICVYSDTVGGDTTPTL